MYFNIEIGILDQYIVECEVHVLVFVNYWICVWIYFRTVYEIK